MFHDLRFASRSLAKSPGFVAVVLLTLSLGIGVNTSMYTLVDALFFRSVPFDHAEELVSIFGTSPQGDRETFSFDELNEIHAETVGPDKPFQALTTYGYWTDTFTDPDRPAERLASIDASADFFSTFHVQPMLGRAYTADEETPGKNQVAVLSYKTWQTRFAGDPQVIGRTIRLNAESVTIIGVMPASFVSPMFFGPVDIWRPITLPQHMVKDRNSRYFLAIARMNPGVTMEQAAARLAPISARWAKDYPQTSKDRGFNLMPPHKAAMDSTSKFIVWLLFALGAAVLLVACANIANLQLARATSNVRDLAIRSALGASRRQIIFHQLTESLVLAIVGGACGILVAMWVNALFGHAIRLGPDGDSLSLPMNGRVLLVAFGASLATGLMFGLLPAWFASRHDVVSTLKQQSRGTTSGRGPRLMRNALVVGEVAVALALLSVAGVMIHGLDSLLKRPKGWDTEHLIMANIHLPEQSTYNSDEKRRLAIEKIQRRLKEIPGAERTAVATGAPLFGYSRTSPLQIEGQTSDDPSKMPSAGYIMIAGDYFQTLGLPLLAGQYFPEDIKADSPPTAIINETMAKHFWPNESAIGKRIAEHQGEKVTWRQVIGVVRDLQFALSISKPTTLYQVYKPMVQEPWGYMFLLARGPNPAIFKNDLRRAVSDIDPDLAVLEMYTVPEAADRFQHNLVVINDTIAAFALLGLILASIGLYGVISYLVAQRTSEFGIRIALGASSGDVLGLVIRHGFGLTLIGLVAGFAAAVGLNQMMSNMMPLMASLNPGMIALTGVALLIVALTACWLPAQRATRVDPLEALRAD